MKFIRGFFSRLPAYVLWLIMSIVLWGWIFTRITDAPAEKKITLFVEAPSVSETQLAAELERALPDGIRMIQVHSFDYVMFDTSALLSADLYVVRESSAEQYIDSFLPLEHPTEDCLSMNGVPYGIPAPLPAGSPTARTACSGRIIISFSGSNPCIPGRRILPRMLSRSLFFLFPENNGRSAVI